MTEQNNKVTVKDKAKNASPTSLESALKSKAIWVIGIGLGVIFFAVMFSVPHESKEKEKQPSFSLSDGDIESQSWQVKAQARLEDAQDNAKQARQSAKMASKRSRKMQGDIKDLTTQVRRLQRQLKHKNNTPQPDSQRPPSQTISSDEDKNKKGSDEKNNARKNAANNKSADQNYTLPPPPPKPPGARAANQSAEPAGGNSGTPFGGSGLPTGQTPSMNADNNPIIFKPPKAKQSERESKKGNGPSTNTKYVKNKYAGYLPTGSFAPVVLLSGLDAAASKQTQSNPQPVLMRVQSNATTPGQGDYALNSCVLIGSAYGDLSSERAYIRLTRISCVQPRSNEILESDITGYLTDSDGFQGLRGKLVRRNGQLLAKSILAGFASSISDVASSVSEQNARTITTTGSGVGAETNSVQISPGQIAQAGAFGGVGNAADNLAQYYLDQAKNIFPVISIPPGRKGTVIITEGTGLKWHRTTGRFVKQVTPNG